MKVLHSICQPTWKIHQGPQDWKRSAFIPIPEKGNAKECSNYRTIALISHTSKVMFKILQARLQQYMNCELADVKLELEKVQEPESKLPTSYGLEKKQENSRKKYLFLLYHSKLCKILQEMGLSDHLTCLLRNLYAGQEATVRT